MADLIAQGPEPHQRWRRTLPAGERVVLGRSTSDWAVPWDDHISRQHAALEWSGGRLQVERLPTARNPVFVRGAEASRFALKPGEHFVIGQTMFMLADERVNVSLAVPDPLREQTFSAQHLRRVRFRNPDQRLEVLARLPEVISGSTSETELYVRLVNLLLAGIPQALGVALVAAQKPSAEDQTIRVLHWDQRVTTGGDFEPSRRLILEAIGRQQSVLHLWRGEDGSSGDRFTAHDRFDWAFATPVPGEACSGWAIYVAGRFGSSSLASTPIDPADLREDLKFTELVAATLSALWQLKLLERRNASLSRFFPPAVLAALASGDPQQVLAPREADVCVLFCDLRGFSRRAEQEAGDLFGLLNRVSKALGVMTHHILAQQGVIGDFQGDAAMGFWGWPIPQADRVVRACRAALAIRADFLAAARNPDDPLAGFRAGMGLATGRVVAGGLGTIDQLKVSVFGPVVNLASRLEGMTRLLQAPILIDEATAAVVRREIPKEVARCRRLAVVRPYGLQRPMEASELLPPEADFPGLTDEHLAHYEAALDAFLAGDWSAAIERLHHVPAHDRVKDFLTVFIAQHGRTPPPGWDGVIPLETKG